MMKHLSNLFIYLLVIAITGCSPEVKMPIEEGGQEDIFVGEFDPMEYLNNSNSNSILYKGTKKYKNVIKKEKVIFEQRFRMDLFKTGAAHRTKIDSVRSWVKNDTLYVSHIFLAKGRCLDMYPYLEEVSGFLELNAPEIKDGSAFIEDGDTLIETTGCALMNMVEFTFKIPTNKILDVKGMTYYGQEIKAYRTFKESI